MMVMIQKCLLLSLSVFLDKVFDMSLEDFCFFIFHHVKNLK